MGKTGFSYYMAETDRFQDIKIKRLKKRYGCEGYTIYQYALNEIYRVEGCWIQFSEDELFDASEYWGIEEDRVKEIVHYCAEIMLFDTELWERQGILTARSIQSRYLDMCKRSKKKAVIPPDVLLVELETTPELTPEPMPLFIGQPGVNAIYASKQEVALTPEIKSTQTEVPVTSVPEVSRTFRNTPENSGKTPEKSNKVNKNKTNESKRNSPSIPQGNLGVPPEQEEEKARLEVRRRLDCMLNPQVAPPASKPGEEVERNIEGLLYQLQQLNLTASEQEEVMRLSGHGKIGDPVWGILNEIRTSRNIKMPRLFLLSRLRKAAAS